MAYLINLRKFSNYKTISLAQLIFLTTIYFMDTYFYFSNQLTESKTTKESFKTIYHWKTYTCDFAQKSKLCVLLIKKKSTTLFCFFTCLVALNWTREFFPSLLFNTLQHFSSTIVILSTNAFFFTTPFYFFTVFHYMALLHKTTLFLIILIFWFRSLLFRGIWW